MTENLINFNLKYQYFNNTKLYREIANLSINNARTCFKINIGQSAVINIKFHTALKNVQITQYDLTLLNSIYTLKKNGMTSFSLDWLGKIISGNQNQKLTQQKIKRMKESIEKLNSIIIEIDCTEEFNLYQHQKKQKTIISKIYKGALLSTQLAVGRYAVNGKTLNIYKLLTISPLFQYAEMNHQILYALAYFLDTKQYFSDTDESIIIKRYVVQKILIMRRRNKINNHKISLEWENSFGVKKGLYIELGYKPLKNVSWRKKKHKICLIITKTLDHLIDCHVISKYEAYRNLDMSNPSLPIMGYKIFLSK